MLLTFLRILFFNNLWIGWWMHGWNGCGIISTLFLYVLYVFMEWSWTSFNSPWLVLIAFIYNFKVYKCRWKTRLKWLSCSLECIFYLMDWWMDGKWYVLTDNILYLIGLAWSDGSREVCLRGCCNCYVSVGECFLWSLCKSILLKCYLPCSPSRQTLVEACAAMFPPYCSNWPDCLLSI